MHLQLQLLGAAEHVEKLAAQRLEERTQGSDIGNTFVASSGTNPAPPDYTNGRFSNGDIWLDYLATDYSLTVAPSLSSDSVYTYSGAKTGSAANPPGILTQVNTFQTQVPLASASGLYIVQGGINDYLDGQADPTVPVDKLTQAITDLYNGGACTFLVANLPDLGTLPQNSGGMNASAFTKQSVQHNAGLSLQLLRGRGAARAPLSLRVYMCEAGKLYCPLVA